MKITMIVLLGVLFMPTLSQAEWLDDYVNQKTYLGPSYFKQGTNRKYGTLGQASLRWNNATEYVMGITKPQWPSRGCGGIDLFLGGFQFMEFQYLVDKFQRMMGPAAAAFAFDIALNALSSQSSNTIKTLSGIIDRLNQLQFSDCETQKSITKIMHAGTGDNFKEDAMQAVVNHSLGAGISDLYHHIGNTGKHSNSSDTAQTLGTTLIASVNGCPNDIKEIFFNPGYILNNLNDLDGFYTSDHMAMLRGLIGDMEVLQDGAGNLDYLPIARCPQGPGPETVTIDDFLNGNIQKRVAGNCVSMSILTINGINYTNLRDYYHTMIQGIADSVVAKTPYTPNQRAFLNMAPGPFQYIIKEVVILQGVSVNTSLIADEFIDYFSTLTIFNMVNDFISQMNSLITRARSAVSTYKGTDSGQNQETCNIALTTSAVGHLDQMRRELSIYSTHIRKDFIRKTDALANQVLIDLGFERVDRVYQKHITGKMAKTSDADSRQGR